ncbi:ATP-binding cassette domain-containing protein [Tissierella sp. P1]|uniref:ATP-binding cassette domain-containing protein n=1 Tax=Tissierella sp. P1 TaxID=1280483 RepID=UPI0019128F25|nr:ATP-binding cassette domain-containing protein [Tissierella sp. P1]MDU5081860.1 ATP-binding cassette domain-containing protein [Bacillota bacterium]
MSKNILEVIKLKKEFTLDKGRKIKVVKGINFNVRQEEMFGFLGANGAGKSTTISMLTTQKRSTSGEILIAGESLVKKPAKARRKIGVVAVKDCNSNYV